MEGSLFAKLPPELRTQIWELVLRSNRATLEIRDIKKHISLTQTCRQIRQESQPIFASNNFAFTTWSTKLDKFCDFLQAIGPTVIPQIRSLRLLIIQRVPCRGAPLQCSQNIEIRGTESADAMQLQGPGKYHGIRPTGVEATIYETLMKMGLQARAKGSTWYTTAVWYVGPWVETQQDLAEHQWLQVTPT